ncbi:hypothetical protein Prudu_012747 [Prunus dulcis]|uniref:Uncharacterized protein n=1 Tax=Prunus dulcis TaxID=3755 RepID=A0A4Y1RE75_PRUDU|nr:hypothetical protein Prudu_012747 [Prunus dulcis]
MAIGHRGPHRSRVDRSAGFPVNRVSDLPKSVPVSEKANVGIGVIQDEMHVFLGAGGRVHQSPANQQEGPSRGPASSDQLWKTLGMVKLQGRLCRIFGRSRKRI